MVKDTDEQADEEVRIEHGLEDPECESSCPRGVVVQHPPGTWVCSPLQKLNILFSGCLWRLHHFGIIRFLTPAPACLPSREDEGGLEVPSF